MPEYTVRVTIDKDSIKEMDKYTLYGFKAVRTSGDAEPVVWFADNSYTTDTDIAWHTEYQAYASPYAQTGPISTYHPEDIQLGETFVVESKKCLGRVDGKPDPTKPITVTNRVPETKFRVGIAQKPSISEEFRPLCTSTMIADGTNAFSPVEKVLLIFATAEIDEGAVITRAFSAGVLIDLTGAAKRSVTFSTQKSWGWAKDAKWAEKITQDDPITKHLISAKQQKMLMHA
ncbi:MULTISPECIES: hypothetical protein [Streptomyces]|uniref:hypothetical protein n=1 Tax=Streptomyces TaxID=1883 RepID=UPI0019663455|nr:MULTISPECIES: hypothetical protein [Streptomyces]QRX91887.1 hypothetical protein JNO44_14385 [Streptomyces noursei]UJB41652.1 hypothetical protein HRD51_13100 [Streptomyces sp. A1-5]